MATPFFFRSKDNFESCKLLVFSTNVLKHMEHLLNNMRDLKVVFKLRLSILSRSLMSRARLFKAILTKSEVVGLRKVFW